MSELSPVRKWIINQITTLLPSDSSIIRSDTDYIKFKEWTLMSQADLERIWIQEDTQRAINNIAKTIGASTGLKFAKETRRAVENANELVDFRKKTHEESLLVMSGGKPFTTQSLVRSVGTTTTCNAFLGVVVAKTLTAGGLARRVFNSFDLPKAGGTAWNWYPTPDKSPQPGDFYEVGKRGGTYEHVGIIVAVNGENWSTADSGQGGPGSGYDAIKRKARTSAGAMGWIDVDEYFKGWNGGEQK